MVINNTAESFIEANLPLAAGTIAYETDTGRIKIGNNKPYANIYYSYGITLDEAVANAGIATEGSQVEIINEIQLVNAEVTELINKTPSDLITEIFDSKEFVYLLAGPATGEIDYISYKLGISEVARITFNYDGSGNLTTMLKT